jgi:hypothetical protein
MLGPVGYVGNPQVLALSAGTVNEENYMGFNKKFFTKE